MPRISEQRRADRRRAVLEAAWSCFTRRGFQATSVDDIAAEADVSPGTFYTYFTTKDALIAETASTAIGVMGERLRSLATASRLPGPDDVLRVLAAEFRSRDDAHDYDLTRIAIEAWGEALRDDEVRESLTAGYDANHRILTGLAGRWADEGLLAADVSASQAADLIVGLVPGMMLAVATGQSTAAVESIAARLLARPRGVST